LEKQEFVPQRDAETTGNAVTPYIARFAVFTMVVTCCTTLFAFFHNTAENSGTMTFAAYLQAALGTLSLGFAAKQSRIADKTNEPLGAVVVSMGSFAIIGGMSSIFYLLFHLFFTKQLIPVISFDPVYPAVEEDESEDSDETDTDSDETDGDANESDYGAPSESEGRDVDLSTGLPRSRSSRLSLPDRDTRSARRFGGAGPGPAAMSGRRDSSRIRGYN
jgi:hypothetical protein